MNTIRFNLVDWLALSPGLTDRDNWMTWASLDMTWPENPEPVPANLIPSMMRRRTSSQSKLALQTAISLTQDKEIDYIIFASRHGELNRLTTLQENILQGEDASPTLFSQTVHNTAAGLFTIATKRPTPVTSLASGQNTLHNALIEASAYLSETPESKVLVVDFDEPLPERYSQFDQGNYQGYALGLLLTSGSDYQISWERNTEPKEQSAPFTLEVIRQFVGNENQWTISTTQQCWHWQRPAQ
ncbi:beta-ketoacyl synthase chain length factor [uncultured Photobacterium sp.]|uniref:beta-ketoacyl synthase chain length factor n=1 Tax=uncultured Photobacterium sp. TaxID=173973 RepID=UPI0026349561|nr:beta-ketoacyl synthase chain length factor [uncultured Photobacterium sp.]